MRLDVYTDNGAAIPRILVGQHIKGARRRFYGEVEVMIESGVGLTSTPSEAPQAVLSVSDDGGRTFHSARARGFGAAGDYKERLLWTRNGSALSRTFKLEITDPVAVAITGARVEFSE